MNRTRASLLALAASLLAGCASHPPQPAPREEANVGAAVGDFCWSRYPLLQQEQTCAEPEVISLAMDGCARTALEVLSHSHAANRDWYGKCMKRYGLTRLEK